MRFAVKGGNLMGQIPYGYRIENGAAVIIPVSYTHLTLPTKLEV